jgi:hypothetical protein
MIITYFCTDNKKSQQVMRKIVYPVLCFVALALLVGCEKTVPQPDDSNETVEQTVDIEKLFNLWRSAGQDEVVKDADGSLRSLDYLVSVGDVSFPMSFYYSFRSDDLCRYAVSYVKGQYYYFKTDTDRVTGKKLYVTVSNDKRSISTNVLLGDGENYEVYSCTDSDVALLWVTGRKDAKGEKILLRNRLDNLYQANRQFEKLAVSREDPGFRTVVDNYLDALVRYDEERSGETWSEEMIQAMRQLYAEAFDKLF